jgi:hypothetical protein
VKKCLPHFLVRIPVMPRRIVERPQQFGAASLFAAVPCQLMQ